MKKIVIYRSIALIALSVLLICAFSHVYAYDVNGYHISSYDTIIDVQENNVLYITENITAVFTADGKHGIIRTIPTVFENRKVHIDNIYVDTTYSVESSREYIAIRIGDADRYVKGEVKYTISYYYDYGDDGNENYDKIYHNILGTDWDCDVNNVTFAVNMPKSFDKDNISITYGDRYSTSKYVDYTVTGNTIRGEVSNLYSYQGVTLALELPEGYFVNERPIDGIDIPVIAITAPIAVLVLIYCVLQWYKKGKDDQLFAAPEFYPVKGQSPAEAGYIIDGVIDNKDITSLIFYWADKGYLEITDKKWSYEFTKLQEPKFDNEYEQYMFDKFFEYGVNNTVSTNDLKDHFYTAIPVIKQKIKYVFRKDRELVSKDSLKNRAKSALITVIPFIVFLIISWIEFKEAAIMIPLTIFYGMFYGMILGLYVSAENKWNITGNFKKFLIAVLVTILLVISASIADLMLASIYPYYDVTTYSIAYFIIAFITAIALAYSMAMKKRSEYGQKMMEHYLGFKDFIATAEMDRIKMLIDENPKYFYNVLPYAIVLGLEKKWGKKFESIVVEPPQWYHGYNMRTFSTVYLLSRMNSCLNQTTASMAKAPSTSSGGGFSSGGFSGGGGGGGGGSSW